MSEANQKQQQDKEKPEFEIDELETGDFEEVGGGIGDPVTMCSGTGCHECSGCGGGCNTILG